MPRKRVTYARLDDFTRGIIIGMRMAGAERQEICDRVRKTDGSSPSIGAVDAVLHTVGKRSVGQGGPICPPIRKKRAGRARKLTKQQEKRLVNLVFRERGKAKVTAKYCKKVLPFLRVLHQRSVCNYLQRAGLAWLTRRKKTAVPPDWRKRRLEHCDWILSRRAETLKRWAYTDGTTFYLARGPAESVGKQRAALGPHVWRMASGKDGLWDANVGPSLYAKSQGKPVKIWGFFAGGRLEYHVLPADDSGRTTNMNGTRYKRLVQTRFGQWRRKCLPGVNRVILIQDGERCLWKPDCLDALRDAGCDVLHDRPKYSPDLNAIEGWWAQLRRRLETTSPTGIEKRSAFVKRLRRTVTWMNINMRREARILCTNQKTRARAIKATRGALCSY